MKKRRRYAALLAIGALAAVPVAGCGGDDDDEGDGGEATAPAATSTAPAGGGATAQAVTVSLTDFALNPADLTVKAGTVTFNVVNNGQTTHALEVEGPKEEVETEELAPDSSAKLTVDLSEPGSYEMYCPVDGHKEQGMEGEITVQ